MNARVRETALSSAPRRDITRGFSSLIIEYRSVLLIGDGPMRLYAYSDLQMDGALRWRVIVDSTLLLEPSYSIEQLQGLLTALLLSGIDLQAHISRAEQEEEANAFNAALKAAQETSERAIVARDNH